MSLMRCGCETTRPLTHKNNNFNCRVIIHNQKILMIRPKMWMANDGNYVSFDVYQSCPPCVCPFPSLILLTRVTHLVHTTYQRELRHFAPWNNHRQVEDHILPSMIRDITGQTSVPFGDGVLNLDDTVIGVELCEELFTPAS